MGSMPRRSLRASPMPTMPAAAHSPVKNRWRGKVSSDDPENLNETAVLMVRTLAFSRYTSLMNTLRLKETVR